MEAKTAIRPRKYRTELLAEARDRKGLRNSQIWRDLGLEPSLVSLTMRGLREGEETVEALAKYLGVPMKRLRIKS